MVDEVDRLREAVRLTREERPFEIHAWVVLPDHIHAVWGLPSGDKDYGLRWGAIKSRFSRSYLRSKGWPRRRVGLHPTDPAEGDIVRSPSKARKGDAGIWQRRFWEHHVRDRADFDAHIRYCWANPVNHGLVERPVEWPYSSIHREIRAGRVDPDWSGRAPDGDFGEPIMV